jgi:hypothetical protein
MSLTFTAYITVGGESYSLGNLGTNGLIKRLLVPFIDEPENEPFSGYITVSTAVMWVLERLAEDPNESSIDFKNIVRNIRRAFDSPNVQPFISCD